MLFVYNYIDDNLYNYISYRGMQRKGKQPLRFCWLNLHYTPNYNYTLSWFILDKEIFSKMLDGKRATQFR